MLIVEHIEVNQFEGVVPSITILCGIDNINMKNIP